MTPFLVTRALEPGFDHFVGKILDVDTQYLEDCNEYCWTVDYVTYHDPQDMRLNWRADLWDDVEGKYLYSIKGEEREMYKMLYPSPFWELSE